MCVKYVVGRYAALFIERMGSCKDPQGLVTGADGQEYVRVWPSLTMLDQGDKAHLWKKKKDQSKGRTPPHQQAVKFSTVPTSWGAKWGFRKFVRRERVQEVKTMFSHRPKSLLKKDALLIQVKLTILVSLARLGCGRAALLCHAADAVLPAHHAWLAAAACNTFNLTA